MDDYPFCSVVIPAVNEEECIERCLLSLNDQTYPRDRFEIIVVDNGSTDATQSIAEKHADWVLEKPGVNVGAVRNYGARHAAGDILVCTDSDCLFDKAWIENGVNLLQAHPDHVFGGGVKSGDNATWIERYWLLNDQGENIRQQKDLMGSCIFIWNSSFVEAGGFREDVTSGEDTELSKTLVSIGKTVLISKALSIVHLGNARTIASFAKRQIWHSENYLRNIQQSLKDPVFYLVLFFFILFCFSVVTFAAYPVLSFRLLVLALLLPAVLSAKRIIRARLDMVACLTSTPMIYILDLLYLASRSIGLVKGIRHFRHA
ncbi:MAG: glycosyltransferase family 2 protein [Marinobacter sp.]